MNHIILTNYTNKNYINSIFFSVQMCAEVGPDRIVVQDGRNTPR